MYEIWQFDAEFHAVYADVVKVKTGRRMMIWRKFVFAKR